VSPERRIPPEDPGAEQDALGAAMLTTQALEVVLRQSCEEDYSRPAHRTIYRALAELHTRGQPVDATTVAGELRRHGELADVGGGPFLHTLVAGVAMVEHVSQYVESVATLGWLRRMIDAGHRLVAAGYQGPDDTSRALADARAMLADAAASNGVVGSRLLAGLRNGAWLNAQHFPPLAYTVPAVIPEGLVLFVGAPKIGKSWFVLAVSLGTATGGRVLGVVVVKRPVLYLALEDGDRRIQDRCRKLLGDKPIPPEFEYLTRVEPDRIVETIALWLGRRPGEAAPLVVLDTLGKVMPPALLGESSYQRDYRIGSALKRLADQHPGMTLLVNHHDRKAGAEDFIDSVSGTHGLAGAADTVVVLTRPRHEEAGLLKVAGRDVAEGEYAVRFVDGCAWELDGDDLAAAARRARDARVTAGLGDRST
jgi:DnaB-like helicase N terminal domain/AAA domain